MIVRRTFLAGAGAFLLARPLAADAQQSKKMVRVGTLSFGPVQSPEEQAKIASTGPFSLSLSMKELGWVVGQNMVIERRWGESVDQLRAGAAELVRLKVDVLFAGSASLAKILQLETKTIPIVVWSAGGDLVAAGLAGSLAKPGGNLTGIQILNDDLISKRFELLKAVIPKFSKVAYLQEDLIFSVLPQMHARYDQQAATAARALGVELHTFVVHRAGEFSAAFLGMMKNRDQGVLVMSSPFTFARRQEIVDLAAKHRIAGIYEYREFVAPGGLMSYGVNLPEIFRHGAVYVDKILRGAKPGDLPIEQPTKFELVINLKSAQALGLTIPQSLLLRADEVIQ